MRHKTPRKHGASVLNCGEIAPFRLDKEETVKNVSNADMLIRYSLG